MMYYYMIKNYVYVYISYLGIIIISYLVSASNNYISYYLLHF